MTNDYATLKQLQRQLSEEYLLFFSKLRLSLSDLGLAAEAFKAEDGYLKTQQAIRLIGRALGAGDTPITDKEIKQLSTTIQQIHRYRDYFIQKSKTQQKVRQAVTPLITSGTYSLQNIILPPLERTPTVTTRTAPSSVGIDPLLQSRLSLGGMWNVTESLLLSIKRNIVDAGLLSPLIGPFAGPLSVLLTIPSAIKSFFNRARSFFFKPSFSKAVSHFASAPETVATEAVPSGYMPTVTDSQDVFKKSLFEFFDKDAFKARWTRLLFLALSKADKKAMEQILNEAEVEGGGGIGKGIGVGLGMGLASSVLKGLLGAGVAVAGLAALSSDTVIESIKKFAQDPKKALASLYDALVSVYEKMPEEVKEALRQYTPTFIKNFFGQIEEFLRSDKPLLVTLSDFASNMTKRLVEVISSLAFGVLRELSEFIKYKTREHFPKVATFFGNLSQAASALTTDPLTGAADLFRLSGINIPGMVDISKEIAKKSSLAEMLLPYEVFMKFLKEGKYKEAFYRLGGMTPQEYAEAASSKLVAEGKIEEAEQLRDFIKNSLDLFFIEVGKPLQEILNEIRYTERRQEAKTEQGTLDTEKLSRVLEELSQVLSKYRLTENRTPPIEGYSPWNLFPSRDPGANIPPFPSSYPYPHIGGAGR